MTEWLEVEIKARVSCLAEAESRLPKDARPLGKIDYRDSYYTLGEAKDFTFRRFRLRREHGQAVVTAKSKLDGLVEATRESEFEVNDPEAFLSFARMFGFVLFLEKVKRGKRYALDSGRFGLATGRVSVELIEVSDLGPFVEIEVIVHDEAEVPRAEDALRKVLAELGVPEEAVELRPYTAMLFEKARGGAR